MDIFALVTVLAFSLVLGLLGTYGVLTVLLTLMRRTRTRVWGVPNAIGIGDAVAHEVAT